MCSRPSTRLVARLLGALIVAVPALVVLACGKKGDPLPAPRTLPQAASDLKVRQRGLEVVLEFAYPKATVAGLPLPGIDAITLYEFDRPLTSAPPAAAPPAATGPSGAPPPTPLAGPSPTAAETSALLPPPEVAAQKAAVGAAAPTPPTAVQPAAPAGPANPAPSTLAVPAALAPVVAVPAGLALPDRKEFMLAAKPLLTLAGGELASAISGDRVTVRFPLSEPIPAAPPARFFAVRTHATGGEISDWSNLAGLLPCQPPPPPTGFVAVAAKDGVELSWQAAPAAGVVVAGYNVYRRDAARTSYGDPIARLDATTLATVDRGAIYGRRFIYTVTAIASREPLAESALASEREIDYQDRFAPAPPGELSALGSVGEVRLVWRASPDADVVGYVIERADPDADFHRVNATPTPELEFTDRGLSSGFTFRYRVSAIDKSGNLGSPGEPASTRVP